MVRPVRTLQREGMGCDEPACPWLLGAGPASRKGVRRPPMTSSAGPGLAAGLRHPAYSPLIPTTERSSAFTPQEASMSDIWARLPAEPPVAFDVFRRYRDMPPQGRSLDAVANELRGNTTDARRTGGRRRRTRTRCIQVW